MGTWTKCVSGNTNEKHSGGNSQDVDLEEAAVIPVISTPVENLSQFSSSSDPPTESSQTASTSDEKTKPMAKQDDLTKNIESEKDILLGLYRKRKYGMFLAMNSNELTKRESKKKKLENEMKVAENNRL